MNVLDPAKSARARLECALAGGLREEPGPLPPLKGSLSKPRPDVRDLLVTHCEVNDRHGTGALLGRLFEGETVAVLRSRDVYDGRSSGDPDLRLTHGTRPRQGVFRAVVEAIGSYEIRRILCVPFFPDDALTAVAAKEITGAPLCTWIMDDQNITTKEIPDGVIGELFEKSGTRLAISTELRNAYEEKFGHRFHLMPPVAPASFVLRRPTKPDQERLACRRGVVVGNIWGNRWLEDLLGVLGRTDLRLEWPNPGGTPWRRLDAGRLHAQGIDVLPRLPEDELVSVLRASPYVVVPSGAFDPLDGHSFVARLSLPSRIPFVVATAGTPIIVLGHPETAAARFVRRHGVGLDVPYEARAFETAVRTVCDPKAQETLRNRAVDLASLLSSDGAREWLWRTLELGRPADDRFKRLEPSGERGEKTRERIPS